MKKEIRVFVAPLGMKGTLVKSLNNDLYEIYLDNWLTVVTTRKSISKIEKGAIQINDLPLLQEESQNEC